MGPEAAKEEIRERIDLVDFIGQYVALKPAGRNWKGLCPFHQEKTPSFNVNRELKFWKCFGCGAGGDVFSFVERVENVGFVEAMKLLGDRLGIMWETSPAQRETRDEREQILSANTAATEWFRAQLHAPIGAAARAYLDSRGLDEATIERFHIGYAPPGWDNLLNHLNSRGISPERALRAGLVRRNEEQGSLYDVFRNRIIFPIPDVVGRVIAFGGRAMSADDPAKYLNTPETPAFRKGRTFYGLDVARRAIGDEGFAVVVEGYMDVVALAQHGVEHCVATLGTALTEQHAAILARYTPEICLVFDADEAGMQAALRSIRVFENCPAAVKVATLRDGKDPDDYVREFGPQAFRELLEERVGLVEYRVKTIFAGHAGEGPEGRTKAAREVADVLAEVPDIARRQALVAWAADEWAGPDVGHAARLEEALLQELARRAKALAPTDRDAWERVLAEKGIPWSRGRGRERARRLARAEWLEQERRREIERAAIDVARWAGQSPDSPLSPVNSDFIGDMLARKACPVVQSARQQERRMIAGMLQRPNLAPLVLAHLPPKDMLFDSHRDIAVRLAEAAQGSGLPSLAQMIGKLEQDDTAFADAVDIALDEEPYDASTIVDDVRLIREARLLRSQAVPLYKGVRLYNVSERVVEREEGESLAELEQQVREGLANGTLTPDDPIYQRYMEVRRQLQGDGELPVWDIH